MEGKLSRTIDEELGVLQGKIKSSDHYKIFVSPALESLDSSHLGYQLGPVCVGVSGVADDVYLISDMQDKLQQLISIAAHYGARYRTKYGASKTKITVTGSKVDMEYYAEVKPWTMEGTTIDVVSENEHLGLIVSGEKEEEKNVHNRLTKGRKSLFGLLGPAFSQKCLLSPAVKIHLYRMYTCAITRSGLSSMVLRNSHMDLLNMFHKKTLRSFLSLSQRSPIPSLYFIFGELPIEAKIHRDVFSLFFSLISNPKTKAYQMVRYLLHEGSENSRTWSVYLRRLCIKSVSYTHLTLPTKA